jgi:trans-aconitate methyltransferase
MNENINTVEYWDKRFETQNGKTNWELCNGCNQSKNFMKTMINNLPGQWISKLKTSHILDVGCALGDGTNYLYNRFTKAKIAGYDFSKNAVKLAKEKYPDIIFLNELINGEKYDFVLINNVLQCVDDYEEFIKSFLDVSKKYIVIMVPLGIEGTTIEHFNKFELESFPQEIGKFYKRKPKIVTTDNWYYKQILIRYERME